MARCGKDKPSGDAAIDVGHELAMATLHLLAARRWLSGADSCRSTSALVSLCDQAQGYVGEIRALLVALGLTDEDLQTLLSGPRE
ncbi:hypothetical protein ACX6XY_12225 [Streptomyces sp. O3]